MLLPQFERIMDLKMGQIKTEMMQEMKGTLEEMMVPIKKEMMDTVEAMKTPLKAELVNTMEAMKIPLIAELKANINQQIVSASTSIVKDLIVPDLDQKMSSKVEAMKIPMEEELTEKVEAMKMPLKSELKEELTGTVEAMKIPMKSELKEELTDTIESMKTPLKAELKADFDQQIVSASTSIVRNIIVPDLDDKLSAKVEALKVPLKEELTDTVVAMKIPLKSELKEELTGTVEAMKTPLKGELKADFDQQITNRLEEQVPDLDTIVTASSTIVNTILIPQMEQKVTIKVNEIRGIVKNELKSELDQDLSSGMTDLSQQIVTKINEREEAIDEKIIFAVVRTSDVAAGQSITFDTVIANIGESMDASAGTFTAKRRGLYMFTFTSVSNNPEAGITIRVSKNGNQIFNIEDGNAKNQSNISSSWMLQLDQGDAITLLNAGNSLHGCKTEDWINFTGQFLNAN